MMNSLWLVLALCLLIFFGTSATLFMMRGRRRRAKNNKTPVVVTSTTHTVGYPAQTGGFQTTAYAPPYPTQSSVTMQMPMPMPNQAPTIGAQMPYPVGYAMPMPPGGNTNNPPSYDAAVGAASALPINTTATYEKQAPYNPNFAG